ncbi:MAG: branched-chain amino acid ABC transporter permease [Dethiobacter sp.]|nr:MAG: branched-chain amino acid ABC transporter permease [Dethiobacter sp.]
MFIQVLSYGIMIGAIYGLVGSGLALMFGVMKYLNIAHGTFIMLGGYASYWLFTLWGLDPFKSIPLVLLIMFTMGIVVYKIVFSPLVKVFHVGERIQNSMLITFGLLLIIDNTVTWLWTSDVRSITTSYTGSTFRLYSVNLPYNSLIGFGLALLALLCLHLIINNTYYGKSIRATTQDWEGATLMGINVDYTYLISSGVTFALSGVAGIVIATSYSITPSGGLEWLLKAMIVLVLAGEGKTKGILAAGLFLGVVEAVGVSLVGSAYREVFGLLAFILVLLFRPQGLFTER